MASGRGRLRKTKYKDLLQYFNGHQEDGRGCSVISDKPCAKFASPAMWGESRVGKSTRYVTSTFEADWRGRHGGNT